MLGARSRSRSFGASLMIAANGVYFSYPGSPGNVLDHVSMQVGQGDIVGLLGPNGSGKTTLLRILAGMLTPSAGSTTIAGSPVASLSRRELARRIAVVPQETQSAFDFTVLDIVLMG